MPIYEYMCVKGHSFTLFKKISEYDVVQRCPKCDAPSERKMSVPAPGIVTGSDTPLRG